ncbi:HNH endonuclease [Bacillus pumilus]|uniref:HNH endonuclease n=1 Tax=Bacillus pumilus TaxID=1408 RepID=UPI002ABD9943|nr:HNH endonuclease [Bacillus pumilus]
MKGSLKLCAKVMCPNLTRDKYCEEHKEIADESQVNRRFYDRHKRNKKSKQFYNSTKWKSVRDRRKRDKNNLCEFCLENKKLKVADVCDHIVPIMIDWSKRLDYDNLQMLCHECHNKKTREDELRYGKGL